MSAMCYIIVAKQPQCYGNEQRTKSIISYTAKKICFPTCECFSLALLCSATLHVDQYVSLFFLVVVFFLLSYALMLMVVVMFGARGSQCQCVAAAAAAVANRLCFY